MRCLGRASLSIALAGAAHLAVADIYYVDRSHPAANDSNPGSEALPWRTIQHAADTLSAGDTVWVKNGTYPEQVTISFDGNTRPQGPGFDIGALERLVPLFADGFESGTTAAWSATVP